ncbi:MAG TPA: DUF3288 family protein [Stenomitos sp.]
MVEPTSSKNIDQQHPQWATDRQTVTQMLNKEPSDFNLAELARLKIRYRGFPGGRDIQSDLDKILKQWGLTEAELYIKTREIHERGQVYAVRSNKKEDWN